MIPFGLIYLIGCESDKAVTVFNSPPDADIVSHDNGSEVFEGYPVEFRAALSDVNHDIDQLTARWKVNGEEVCPFLPPDQTGESVCVATINTGDEEVMVEVRDPENASGGEAIILSIVPTEAPTAEILKPLEDGVFYSDYIITFEGKIADAEDDVEELLFTWKSNLDGELSFDTEVETDGTVLGFGYLTEGQHAITLRVEDTTGKSSSANTTINVGGPNTDPTCEITSPESGLAVPVGDLITFEGLATDEDINNNQLTVEWSSDKMEGVLGTSTPNSSGDVVFTYSDLSVDSHTFTMTVTDEKGASCSDFVIVTVGTPPSVIIDAPTSGTYNEGETITFSATVSDNEDQPNEIALEWTTSDGTVLNTQSATSDGTVEFVLSDMGYGQQVVTLTGTDTDGLTASDLVSFTINALPTQPSLTVLPENPKTGDDIIATATGSTDADGGSVTYSYEWVYGSNTINGSMLSSSETAKGQEWTVTATPNDGTADGPSVSQTVTIENTAPTDLVVTITPSSGVYNDSELTCSATANDVDSSDTLVYSYEWSTGATTETIALDGSLNPTDEVTCTATVTDGTDSIFDSTSVTLENREPVLSNLVIETDEGLWNGTTLTCSADVTDADDETPEVSYSWTLADGTTIVDGNTLTLENVSDGDVFTCTASVEDGYNGTDSLTDSVTTTNTLPVVDSVSITPDSVNVGDHTFTCTVETSDADSDDVTVSYEWTINGTPQQETSNMLSGSFTLGMVIACNATPNDGKEDGNVASDDVTIENAKPVVDSVTLSPETVYTNDTITATASLSDADSSQSGDLNASYSWHVVDLDGNDVEVQTGTDNTLSGVSHFSRDEEVYVVVTPNDGVEDGNPTTSSSITISNSIPTAPSVLMYGDPNDPAVEFQDDLVCEVDPNNPSVDADGDTILYTFEWANSDGLQQQTVYTSETSDKIDASSLNADTWECDVSPYDGTDVGPFTTASATVESGCPTEGDGSTEDCPSLDCAKILADGHSTGDGNYWIDPQEDDSAYEVYCLMDSNYDGGGWTLISVHSDDGQDTWTWNNRHYFDTDTTTFGSLNTLNEDFKSMALHDVGMEDLLFIHEPSGVWAGYNDVYNGSGDFGTKIAEVGGPNCTSHGDGYPLSTGTLTLSGRLCSTELFFNTLDRDGGSSCHSHGNYGPTWSANQNHGCPFDDPGSVSSLGPTGSYPDNENEPGAYTPVSNQSRGYGFGWSILGNTGGAGQAENYMQVFVRRKYTDADGDGVYASEDCNDNDVTVGIGHGLSENCPAVSCKDVLDRGNSTGDGTYWIDPDGNGAFEVYCDMTTDGGGWTRIFGIEINNSQPKPPNGTDTLNGLNLALSGDGHLNSNGLNIFRSHINFGEIWFWCHKPSVGRTISIVSNDDSVLDFFSARTNIFPQATDSFTMFPDDTSMLSSIPNNWGAWHIDESYRNTWSIDSVDLNNRFWNAPFFVPFNYHWLMSGSRYECDDYQTYTYNGNWYISVR